MYTSWSHCGPVCLSPCSLHSVFPHHLLRGAAATGQHIRHVPLRTAGHPCVRGQWWVTFKMHNFTAGVTLTSTDTHTHTVRPYILWYGRFQERPECWFAFCLAQCLSGWVVWLLTSCLCSLQPPQAFCQRCTAPCAALSPSLCCMASAMELWRWEQSQVRLQIKCGSACWNQEVSWWQKTT